MNLKEIKENSEIISALSPLPVSIVRQGGNIKQIVIGDIAAPVALIQKGGTYNDWIEVVAAERKTVLTSEVDLLGAKLSKDFDDASEMEKWEKETQDAHSGVTLTFAHSSKTTLVQ